MYTATREQWGILKLEKTTNGTVTAAYPSLPRGKIRSTKVFLHQYQHLPQGYTSVIRSQTFFSVLVPLTLEQKEPRREGGREK